MHLQVRIFAATLLFAALAIGTGTVLLLGYLLAAFSIGVIAGSPTSTCYIGKCLWPLHSREVRERL